MSHFRCRVPVAVGSLSTVIAAFAIEVPAFADPAGPTIVTGSTPSPPSDSAPAIPAPSPTPDVPGQAPSVPNFPPFVPAAPAAPPAPPPPVEAASPITGRLYGFIESRFDATTAEPNGNRYPSGMIARYAPVKGDLAIPEFHVMAQGNLYSRFHYYFNLAAPNSDSPNFDAAVMVRNAWLEVSIFGDALNLRLGKMYRRFGLYNEIIDTVPSFIGIETPTFISGNRPMLTRTTNAMLFGKQSTGSFTVSYAATLGKDETSSGDDVWSPGGDVNVNYDSLLTVGTSIYATAGDVVPSIDLGQGDPAGGVAPWMAHDNFQVYGGYAELDLGSFMLHGEAWVSPHQAVRDPAKVQTVLQNAANISSANVARLTSPSGNYTYSAFDIRAAYSFELGSGDDPMVLIPFADFDYTRNVESIADNNYGGDGQPGESPRGLNMHARLGGVFKPVPVVAFKIELTHAMSDYGTEIVSDEEFWASLSYQWELFHK